MLSCAAFGQCDVKLWKHVYHRSRLKVVKPCQTVTGTVVSIRPEKDGDLHVQLRLDSQFAGLLNAINKSKQGGNLVIEPVCSGVVTQADAVQVCHGFRQSFPALKVGAHVKVTGTYVVDSEHGWREIHPVSSVE